MTKIVSTLKARVIKAIEQQDDRFAVLKVDIKSAFPWSNRKKMRKAVVKWLPEMIGIFDFLYGETNYHTFVTSDKGVCRVEQDQGIIQGSELSMLFFGVYSHGPIAAQMDMIGDATLKYADDIFLHGDVDKVMNIFQTLESEFHDQTSLEFSPQKSELYMPAIDDDTRAELMQRFNVKVTNRGVIALGIPLGNEIYTKTKLEEKAETFQNNLTKCADMCTKQVTLAIIQNTASAYQHIVAVLPPDETQWFGKRIDNINAKVLRNHIFATPDYEFTDDEWKTIMARVKMQLRFGGLGVLSLEDRALMAFVGTQFQIRSAQDNKSKKVVMWWDKTSISDMQHNAAKEVAEIHLGKVQDNCVYLLLIWLSMHHLTN